MITTVGERGQVGRAGRRRSEEDADLGHDARELHLVVEDAAGVEAAGEDLDLLGDAAARRVDEVERAGSGAARAFSWMRTIFWTVFSPQEPAFTV